MSGLQSGEGRMMIDSIVWAQYINVTGTQPRRHSTGRPNVRAAKITKASSGRLFPVHRHAVALLKGHLPCSDGCPVDAGCERLSCFAINCGGLVSALRRLRDETGNNTYLR